MPRGSADVNDQAHLIERIQEANQLQEQHYSFNETTGREYAVPSDRLSMTIPKQNLCVAHQNQHAIESYEDFLEPEEQC